MLTNEDIKVLMEALDALEQKASRDGFTGALLGMMLMDDKEQAKIILLKAKLIQMKDKRAVDEMSDILKRGE